LRIILEIYILTNGQTWFECEWIGKNGLGRCHIPIDFKSRRQRFASDPAIPPVHFHKAIQHILFRDTEAQWPGARPGLVDFVRRLPPEHRPYIRNTRMSVGTIRRQKLGWLKSVFIGVFGGWMQNALHAVNVPTNDGFAGIYDFKQWRRYPGYLPQFADCLREPNGILVVHPGFEENWRRQEFESLRDFAALDGRLNRFQH